MDMKKILSTIDSASAVGKQDAADMKSFMSIVTEGKNPATNRLSMAEQMAVQHYTKVEEEQIQPKVAPPSIIGKYFEAVENELTHLTEAQLEKAYKVSQRVMEKMYPGSLSRHLAQSKTPDMSVRQSAKNSASKMVGESDEIDTITVDIPLFIRLLEYAKEDAKTDMDLHSATERIIELSKEHGSLTMDQYNAIVGDQKALPAPDDMT